MNKAVDFEEALKATGYGKFNIALLLISGASLYTVNTDAYSIGYLLPSAQCDLNMSTFDKGLLTSASFLGMICSSHLWGFIADTKGRKFVMLISLLLSFICTLVNSFVANFWFFVIMRFLSGFCMVGASAATYAYLGEFHVDRYRTVCITCASIFIALAIMALPGVAWLVIPQTWSLNILNLVIYKPWRLFLVLCSSPGLFISAALLLFPESPKFLLMSGKHNEALKVLQKVYAYNTGKREDEYPIKDLLETFKEEDTSSKPQFNILRTMWYQTLPLLQSPNRLYTLVTCSIQFGLFAVSSGLLFWYPQIVNQLAENEGLHPGRAITVCDAIKSAQIKHISSSTTESPLLCSDGVDSSVFEQNLIIGGAYAILFIGIALVVNIIGARNLIVFFLTLSGASGIALCFITYRIVIDYLFVGLLVLSGVAVGIVNATVVNVFPTYLRAMAMSISLMFGRLGSVVASSVIGILMEYDCLATFVILAAVLFVCAGLAFMLPNHSSTGDKNM